MKAIYELTTVPRSYVLCHDDCGLPPGDPQFGWLVNARRLGPFRLVTLEGRMRSSTPTQRYYAALIEACASPTVFDSHHWPVGTAGATAGN